MNELIENIYQFVPLAAEEKAKIATAFSFARNHFFFGITPQHLSRLRKKNAK